jgi:phosphoglycolate phosphatase (TIGR01487 family)
MKLIFIDIDGTITNSKGLIPYLSLKCIDLLKKENFKIVLTSANCYFIVKTLQKYLGLADYIIAENGGVVEIDDEYAILAKKEYALKAASILKKEFPALKESWTSNIRLSDYVFSRPAKNIIQKIKKYVNENQELNVKIYDTKFSLQIIDKNIDKGVAAKFLLNKLGYSFENIYAIGDSEVDIPIFKIANVSFALKNSSSKVKSSATFVTSKSYYKGFAEAVKKIINK